VLLVALIAVTTARGSSIVGEFTQMRDYELRDASRWLANQPPDAKLIAAMGDVPVYYARGRELYLPWRSESQVLAYLSKLGPDYLVLRSEDANRAPDIASWLEHGIPSECAPLVRTFEGPEDVLGVYRWKCGASDPQWLNQWCPQQDRSGTPLCTATPPYVQATRFSNP